MTNEKVNEQGGPAFPISIPGCGDNGWHGMTLRDYFAGQALIGLVPIFNGMDAAEAARRAYQAADAMLEARTVALSGGLRHHP